MKHFALLVTAFCSLQALAFSDPELDTWAHDQKQVAFHHMLKNIHPAGTVPGVVVASPSQKDPDYFYHWVRDAAIIMEVVYQRYAMVTEPGEKTKLENLLLDFADFSKANQSKPGLSGGPGEPKFLVDGEPYPGPWGRPQDDGPALRALVLTHFAKNLLKQGRESLVRERLYQQDPKSTIKFDLDYVAKVWSRPSYDLWEEVKGNHFFTAMVQRRGLLEGAALARLLGDTEAAGTYERQGHELETLIGKFWDAKRGVIVPTINRVEGINYKNSGLDSSVIIGVLLGDLGDGFLSLESDHVVKTVAAQEKAFYDLYPINQNGEAGVAIGRYPEDRYDGYSSNGAGNPWVLNTAYFAKYYYRLAARNGAKKESLRLKGDSFLHRIKYHAGPSATFAEQINRQTGYMQSARDLTWSYGSILDAVFVRP